VIFFLFFFGSLDWAFGCELELEIEIEMEPEFAVIS
jgi:hypothetical protein